ncbi:MAG: hypothetical protein GX907_05415 [Clostridiaceae bacterium]|nr:hypothetical protein [Clostridiaceae bacterium]
MKDERIKKAWDNIEPDPEAKKRMLNNILAAKQEMRRPPLRASRRVWGTVLSGVIAAALLLVTIRTIWPIRPSAPGNTPQNDAVSNLDLNETLFGHVTGQHPAGQTDPKRKEPPENTEYSGCLESTYETKYDGPLSTLPPAPEGKGTLGYENTSVPAGTSDMPSISNFTEDKDSAPKEMDYSLVRRRGEYLIDFDDITKYQEGKQDFATIQFPSMQAFKDAVIQGTLTETQKRVIATAFPKDDTDAVILCDFDNLYVPIIPMTGSVNHVSWGGGRKGYAFFLTFNDNVSGWFHFYTENDYNYMFREEYLSFFERENIAVTKTEPLDENKVATYYSTDAGDFMRIRYPLSADGREFIVDKAYRLRMNDKEIKTSSDVPYQITLFCVEGGERYTVRLFDLVEDPSDAWLMSFGIREFTD